MKLGEMLIRDGRLSEADLLRVINRQAREGGRLGSLLVAEGLIDVETLTVYLGLELGIPIANVETFERCKRSAVQLLTPDQAAHFKCIPIVIQGQTLIVAVDAPHDIRALEEIGQATGYRIIPRVAPEICIYVYLERFYGLPQPERFAAISKRPSSQRDGAQKALPAPPLPGLPPRVDEPKVAPNPAPELRTSRPTTENEEALELDAADLIEELEADDEAPAETAEPATPQPRDEPTPSVPTLLRPDPLKQADALKLISETTKRSDIADAILGHAADIFEVATLLLVRDNMAFGWKGFGPGLDLDRIETLLVPLDANSMFKAALGDERHFRAQAFSNNFHSHWFRILRTPAPNCSIVVICTIGKRIVNLLYGHTESGEDLSNEAMDGLMDIMNAAARAYMRLISNSKSGSMPVIKAVSPEEEEKDSSEVETAKMGVRDGSDVETTKMGVRDSGDVDTDKVQAREQPENKTEETEIIKVDDDEQPKSKPKANKTEEIEIIKVDNRKTQEMKILKVEDQDDKPKKSKADKKADKKTKKAKKKAGKKKKKP
jgi:hypothetical protein